MATISGAVAFDKNRKGSWPGDNLGMDTPITLQSTTETAPGSGLYRTLTIRPASPSPYGGFTFNDVPLGTYNVIEDWGRTVTPGTAVGSGSFNQAIAMPKITKATIPPPSAAPPGQVPAGTTHLDATHKLQK